MGVIAGRELWQWRQQAIAQAQQCGIEGEEVDWLLQGLCGVERLALRLGTVAQQEQVPASVSLVELQELWRRRIEERVPVQYLVGRVPWRDWVLEVSPAVLIPRPETECIVDLVLEVAAIATADPRQQGPWVDLGTGSGAIALGLAKALPAAEILAVDVSAAALAIAQRNAERNGLGDRIQFLQGSWLEPLAHWRGQLAGLVANPPYIPHATMLALEPEVVGHEPHLALDGGADGLDCIRHLVAAAPEFLQAGGWWLVEVMQGQAAAVMALLAAHGGYEQIQPRRDLAGVERFVLARWGVRE